MRDTPDGKSRDPIRVLGITWPLPWPWSRDDDPPQPPKEEPEIPGVTVGVQSRKEFEEFDIASIPEQWVRVDMPRTVVDVIPEATFSAISERARFAQKTIFLHVSDETDS